MRNLGQMTKLTSTYKDLKTYSKGKMSDVFNVKNVKNSPLEVSEK